MERSHRQLCTGLAYRLSRDDTDCFTDRNRLAGCKVRAVALDADAVLGLAGKQRTNLYLCKAALGLFARGDLSVVVLVYLVGDALCVVSLIILSLLMMSSPVSSSTKSLSR